MIFYNKKLSKNSSQHSESKYKRIIENINDLIVIINFGLDIEYINERIVYKLLKYRKEEIIGNSCLDFIHPDDIDKAVEIIKEGFKHGETVVKLRFKHRDGYWLWFECGGHTFRDEENKLKWLIVSRDLTERKLVEQRYQNLFDKS